MAEVNIVRLKGDIINELRNQKYYIEDDIQRVVATQEMNYKDRINQLIYLLGEVNRIEEVIRTTDSVFVVPQQAQPTVAKVEHEPASGKSTVQEEVLESAPTNIVEAQPASGQSHAE